VKLILYDFILNFSEVHRFENISKLVFFTDEYQFIEPNSITCLNNDYYERRIVQFNDPNFNQEGTHYYYRRNPKQDIPTEVELVRKRDSLFREIASGRYLWLTTKNTIEYPASLQPIQSYYQVEFLI